MNLRNSSYLIFVLLVLWIGTGLPVLDDAFGSPSLVLRWFLIMGVLVAFVVMLGYQTAGRADGVLIDSRNKISLSRSQTALWTIVILSAFLVIGLARAVPDALRPATAQEIEDCRARQDELGNDPAEYCVSQPLNVKIPAEILLAMGISLGSVTGSTLIKSNQQERRLSGDYFREEQERLNQAIERRDNLQEEVNRLQSELTNISQRIETAQEVLNSDTGGGGSQPSDEQRRQAMSMMEEGEQRRQAAMQSLRDQQQKLQETQRNIDSLRRSLEQAQQDVTEAQGMLHVNAEPAEASWTDIFLNEKINSYRLIDIGKVQMCLFTVALVFTYSVDLYSMLQGGEILAPYAVSLPSFEPSLATLLAISHGGYLANKLPSQGL